METVTNAYKNNLFINSVKGVENGYVITFSDNSQATITNGKDGKDGENGEPLIDSIIIGENEITFNLTDKSSFSIPLYSALSISFKEGDSVVMAPNTSKDLHYTIYSILTDIEIEVVSSSDIKTKIVTKDDSDLTGIIQISTGNVIDEYSKVIVFVSNGERVIMKTITLKSQGSK